MAGENERKKDREMRDETFESFRDARNKEADDKAFLRSLGHVEAPADEKVKTVRDLAAEKIDKVLRPLHEALKQQGKDDDEVMKLRDLLLKDLTPLLQKEKPEISMMDQLTLGLTDDRSIRRFLNRHGISLDKEESDLPYALGIFNEAVGFFNRQIAKGKEGHIHRDLDKFTEDTDIYNLFKTASGYGKRILTPQACALLRIAMVIDFMKKDPLISSVPQVQGELDGTVKRHVRKHGNLLEYHSGDENEKPIRLIAADGRTKDNDRIIMKLLHKPNNSTSEVLDHIGYRFVTENASDALRLIQQMFFGKSAVLPSINIRINKTKQSLVDPKILLAALKDPHKAEELFSQLSIDTKDHQDVLNESMTGTDNKHSSKSYRAIHITVDYPITVNGNRQFLPIELQFVDKNARISNEQEASHPEYVERQRSVATERILENNVYTAYQKRRKNGNGHAGSRSSKKKS